MAQEPTFPAAGPALVPAPLAAAIATVLLACQLPIAHDTHCIYVCVWMVHTLLHNCSCCYCVAATVVWLCCAAIAADHQVLPAIASTVHLGLQAPRAAATTVHPCLQAARASGHSPAAGPVP